MMHAEDIAQWRHTLESAGLNAVGIIGSEQPASYHKYCEIVGHGVPMHLEYLVRNAACRASFHCLLPGTQSIVTCAAVLPNLPPSPCHFARFCAIGDYHIALRARMQKAADWLCSKFPIGAVRLCVDSAPILERDLAVRSGIASTGFNRMAIHPIFGSFIVLGEILCDYNLMPYAADLGYNITEPSPESGVPGGVGCCPPNHRGCCKACPTGALSEDGYDSSRCLAYWTTQYRGEMPEPYAAAMGDMIWGCDRCQQACPRRGNISIMADDSPLWHINYHDILTSSGRSLRKRLAGTPIADANPNMLQRNVCLAIGNMRLKDYAVLLETAAQTHACAWVQAAAERSLKLLKR